eukprot:1001052_1
MSETPTVHSQQKVVSEVSPSICPTASCFPVERSFPRKIVNLTSSSPPGPTQNDQPDANLLHQFGNESECSKMATSTSIVHNPVQSSKSTQSSQKSINFHTSNLCISNSFKDLVQSGLQVESDVPVQRGTPVFMPTNVNVMQAALRHELIMRARAQQHAAVWLSGQSDPPYLPNRSPRWFPPPYQIPSYYSDIYNQTLHRSQFLPTRPPAHTTQPTVPVTVVTSSTAGSGTDVSGLPPPKSSANSASSVLKGPVGRVIHHALSAFSRRGKFPPTIKNQPKAQISINSKPNDGKSTSSARTVNTPELILAETVLNSLKNLGSSPLQSAQPSSQSSSGQNVARKRP